MVTKSVRQPKYAMKGSPTIAGSRLLHSGLMTKSRKSDSLSALPWPKADAAGPELRFGKPTHGWRLKLYSVIFESETRAGRLFDLVLIAVILTSVMVVVLDSVQPIRARWGDVFGDQVVASAIGEKVGV